MNKQEKFAWARVFVIALLIAYLMRHLFNDNEVPLQKQDDVRDFIANSFYILVMLTIYLNSYVKGVDVDERDRVISGIASKHGFVALSLLLIVSMNVLQQPEFEHWISTRSPFWIEQYLLAAVAFGWWIEASVSVFHYWRDRR